MAGWRERKSPEVLKAHRQGLLGEITSHRAVTTVNVDVASKMLDPWAEPVIGGRRQHGVPKSGVYPLGGPERASGGRCL
jgi:hypothetical protein